MAPIWVVHAPQGGREEQGPGELLRQVQEQQVFVLAIQVQGTPTHECCWQVAQSL
jgi:hypothetical protein